MKKTIFLLLLFFTFNFNISAIIAVLSREEQTKLDESLLNAILKSDISQVNKLIAAGGNVNYESRKNENKSLIVIAWEQYTEYLSNCCAEPSLKIIESLLLNGANPNFKIKTSMYDEGRDNEDHPCWVQSKKAIQLIEYEVYNNNIHLVKLLIPYTNKEHLMQILNDFECDRSWKLNLFSATKIRSKLVLKMLLHATNYNERYAPSNTNFNSQQIYDEYLKEKETYNKWIADQQISLGKELDENLNIDVNEIILNYIPLNSLNYIPLNSLNRLEQFDWYMENIYSKDFEKYCTITNYILDKIPCTIS